MSQKGQGEKGQGEKPPPVPPPPRRPRTSVPPVATSEDVPPSRRILESPTTTSRIARPTSPSVVGPVVPPPRKTNAPRPESGPSSPRRKMLPNAGAIATSSQMAQPIRDAATLKTTKTIPQRVKIHGTDVDGPDKFKHHRGSHSGPSEPFEESEPLRGSRRISLSPLKTSKSVAFSQATLQDNGPSTSTGVPESTLRFVHPMSSAKATIDVRAAHRSSSKVRAAHRSSSPVKASDPSSPAKASDPAASSQATLRDTEPPSSRQASPLTSPAQTTTDATTSRRASLTPVKISDTVASSQATLRELSREAGTSTTPRVPQSRRASLTSPAKGTSDNRSGSPPVTTPDAEPESTSGGGFKMAVKRLRDRLCFKKKTSSPSSQQARRASVTSTQNRQLKTTRILYNTEEEVRDALIEFTVFIIFLILTSLVTLSVRHPYMFYFNDTMKKLFTSRDLVIAPSVTVNFEKQITVPDWWDYLVYNFLITLHGDLTLMDGQPEGNTTNTDQSNPPPEKPPENVEKSFNQPLIKKRGRSNSGVSWDPGENSKTASRTTRQLKSDNWGAMPVPQPGLHHRKKTSSIKHNISQHLEGRVFLYENLLLGPPRIRQIRVRKESCYVNDAFIRYFNSCYAAYSRSSEDRTKFKGIPYQTMTALDSMPIWTVLAFYRSGGYVVDLTYEKDDNLRIITDLKNDHWIDRGSRLCLVEFNLFNDNTDIFQSIKLIAEIPPTGGVIPQTHMQTVKQHSFFTEIRMGMSVIYIFWYIMVIYYTIYEVNEVRKSGFKNYIFSIMNMLDCIILLLCYLALVYNIWHSLKVTSVTTRANEVFTYQSLDVLCFWNIIYVDMMAILAFLVWIKIFKFISFNKTLVQFTTTLKRCSKDLAGFSLMFGIVFLAYAQLGLLLFGTKHPDFRNFITSILTMIRMILGDFQYNLIEQANRVLGPIYFLTYILLVFFILLNMFLAIIMETYNTVKSEITQGSSQLGSYIFKKAKALLYFIIHCGRKRKPNRRDAEEVPEEPKEEPEVLHKNLTATEARYFQEIPPGENKELVRLTNRVSLLEEILEKLITNMDDILKRVEKEREQKKK